MCFQSFDLKSCWNSPPKGAPPLSVCWLELSVVMGLELHSHKETQRVWLDLTCAGQRLDIWKIRTIRWIDGTTKTTIFWEMKSGLFLLNYVALYVQMFGAELTFDFGLCFFFSIAALWETINCSQEIKMKKTNKKHYICYSMDLPHDLLLLPSLCI